MFSLFKQPDEKDTTDVKALRQKLLRGIKEQLQQWEGGEGGNIRNLTLFINAKPQEQQVYESAVYADTEGRFKEEIQKQADDYALDLPAEWHFEIIFSETFPPLAIVLKDLPAALNVSAGKGASRAIQSAKAYIKILNGEAEQHYYSFASEKGRINLGREKTVQAGDGFYRVNNIAFPAESSHPGNKYISRQHAHIEWDAASGVFLLFADEGGVPPRNKVKVKPKGGEAVKLQSMLIGFALADGDQIMLGDGALLEFGYEK